MNFPPLGPAKTSARQRVCAQWRGFDAKPLEKEQAMSARAVGELMPKLLKSLRLDQRRTEAEIVKGWNTLIAPDVIAHAQPTGLRRGTLFVAVDSEVWLCELVRFRRFEILERLRACFGRDLISKISFRVG